jgi:hypothetical protein
MPSSINNPIAFYSEFLFDGYFKFYKDFFEPNQDLRIVFEKLEINKEKRIKTIARYEEDFTGENILVESTSYFPDELSKKLKKQQFTSLQLITEKLNTLLSIEQQQFFIDNLSSTTIKLIEDFQVKITIDEDFIIIENSLKNLVSNVFDNNRHIKPGLRISNILKEPVLKSPLKSFKMQQLFYDKIDILFKGLIEDEFIALDTELEVFRKAFNGSDILKPTLISWTAKVKSSNSSMPLLIAFIEFLIANQIIEPVTFHKKIIVELFANSKGDKFKYDSLKSSNSQRKHNQKTVTRQFDNLSTILSAFKALK